MRPLATFIVWVLFLHIFGGGTVFSQSLCTNLSKDADGRSFSVSAIVKEDESDFPESTNISLSNLSSDRVNGYQEKMESDDPDIASKQSDFYCPQPPVITSFTPTSGTAGSSVIITGTGFDPTPSNNIVYFGATKAAVTAASSTSLTVTVPFGASYQFITVTTPCNLTGFSGKPFVTTFPCGGFINNTSFTAAQPFSTGMFPYSLAMGDVDGDGKADVVVALENPNTVSVLRNMSSTGTINFAAGVDFPTGISPRSVSIGDIDGDGKPDLVVGNFGMGQKTISVYRNTCVPGTISFAAREDFVVDDGPISIAINDIDGDGKPDLAVANFIAGTISILNNNSTPGSVSFAAAVNYPTSGGPKSIALYDIDGDRKPELVIANENAGTVSVVRNMSTPGNINFFGAADFATGTAPTNISIGDLDGDGRPEIAVANLGATFPFSNGGVTILRNQSFTGFISFAPNFNISFNNPFRITMGDLDGDSKPDLVVKNYNNNTLALFKNTSTSGSLSFMPNVNLVTQNNTESLAIGDLDNDGKPDIALTDRGWDIVSVFRNLIAVLVTPTVNIVATPASICAGTPATFTATQTNGGFSPTYQWQVNGVNTGTNAATFTSSTLSNGDVVRVIMTSSATCPLPATVISNPITVVINPIVSPAVSLSANQPSTICAGTPVTFTATAFNTNSGSVQYTFSINGSPVQTGPSNVYSTSTLPNGAVVSCSIVITGGACLTANSAVSNSITMTVNPSLTPTVVLAVSPAGPVCAGTPVIFTATAAGNGTGTVNFTFYVNGNPVQSGAANTYTSSALTNGNTVSCMINITGGTCLTSTTATSNSISMAVNPNLTPAVSLVASPSGPICASTPVTFTATAVNTSSGAVTYTFYINGTAQQAGSSNVFAPVALANGNNVSCMINVAGGTCLTSSTAVSNTISMTVNPNLTPTVVLAANPAGPVCSATPISFTATASNTSTGSLLYTFFVNGSPVQTGAANIFTSSTLTNGNTVSCSVAITGGTCLTAATALSNTIPITISATVAPAVSITTAASTICAGSAVTFTATPVNGGGSPSYQWQVNGVNTGSNSSNFTTSSLSGGDQVSVIMNSSLACASPLTASSNTITMTVNPNLTPTLLLAANPSGPVCANTPVMFTATATNTAGGSITYTFFVNGNPVQTGAANTFTSSALTNGNTVTCSITIAGGSCLTATTISSNPVVMTVNPNFTPAVVVAASPAGPVCAGTPITFTATPSNTGTGSITYTFYVDGSPVQSSASPAFTTSTLSNGNIITCSITIAGGSCLTASTTSSNPVLMTVNPNVTPAVVLTANPSGPVCAATPVTFTATPSNTGTGNITYTFYIDGNPVQSSAVNTYTSSTLSNGAIVSCNIDITGGSCLTSSVAVSNSITMQVNPGLTPTVVLAVNPTGPVCANSLVTFTATAASTGTGTVTYTFYINGNPQQISGSNIFATFALANGNTVSCSISIVGGACLTATTAVSNTINMVVNPTLTPAVVLAANPAGPVCAGTPVTFTATPSNTGTGAVTYTFYVDGSPVQSSAVNTFTSSTLSGASTVYCDINISGGSCLSSATAISNSIDILVNPALTPTVVLAVSPTGPVCANSLVTFTATAANAGTGTVTYTFNLNGNPVQSSAVNTFTTSTLSNGNTVSCSISVAGGTCLTATTAVSNTITMAVNPTVTPSVVLAVNPAGTVCAGTPISFSATVAGTGAGSVIYTFYIDGNPVQNSASPVYTSTALVNGSTVSCIITVNGETCMSSPTAVSNSITTSVTATLTPAVSITTPITTICTGSPVTFTANAVNGGASPVYQWQVNAVNTGTNAANFTSSTLSNGDQVNVIITSSFACTSPATATSNILSMTVNPANTPTVAMTANPATPICAGTAVSFTAVAANTGTGTVTYLFSINGSPVQSSASNIYSSSGLTNGDIVSCAISIAGGTCLTASTASSNSITMVVNPYLTPVVSLGVSPAGPVCAATPVTFTATAANTGTGISTYTFYNNGNPVQTSAANSYTSSSLGNGDIISCTVSISGGSCLTSTTATSNTITLQVNPNLTPGVVMAVNPTGPVCAATAVTFTATPANTGSGSVSYTFSVDGSPVQTSASNTFTSSTLSNGNIVSCTMAISGGTCLTSGTAVSNPVTMQVNPVFNPAVVLVASPAGPVCAATPITFTATSAGTGTGTVTYTFLADGNPVQSGAATTYTSSSLANGTVISCMITITGGSCLSANNAVSNTIPVTISAFVAPAVSISTPVTAICSGTAVTFAATAANAGTNPFYQWKVNGVNTGTNTASFTSTTLSNGDQVSVTVTSSLACASPLTASSGSIGITVNPVVVPALRIDASDPVICTGDAVTFTAIPGNGATPTAYQWQLNGVTTGGNSPVFKPAALSNGDIISVVMTYNATCVTAGQVTAPLPVLIDPQKCPQGFYIPTGFTPNNDGKNDLFKPLLFSKTIQYRFSIYNRWGQRVFETTDVQKGWDGKVGGKDTDSNVFIWMCSFQFEAGAVENRKGTVVLIR